MFKCPKCRFWEIKEGNRFCSWCGAKLLDMKIYPEKMRFYLDKEKGTCSTKNKIVLENRGWTAIQGVSLAYDKTIFNISGQVEGVQQGEKRELAVEIPDSQKIELGMSSTIIVEVGKEKHYINTDFYYLPEWTLQLEDEVVLPLDGTRKQEYKPFRLYKFDDKSTLHFKLEKSELTVFEVDDIIVEGSLDFETKITDTQSHCVQGQLTIDNKEAILGKEQFVQFKIKGKYTQWESAFPFFIKFENPPDFFLMVNGTHYKQGSKEVIEIYAGIENKIIIKIINKSSQDLTLKGISLTPPFHEERGGIIFPRILKGQQELELTLKLDPREMNRDEPESQIIIHSGEIGERTIDFIIEKKESQPFDGYLSVDFGTTNTTIAYLEEGKIQFIALENIAEPAKSALSPSVIRYEKVKDTTPLRYSIGEHAKGLMILNPKSSVMAVKTRLGGKNIRILPVDESCGLVDFSPLDITTHMIQRLKEISENHLKRKINQSIITYPSKFTNIQIDQLKSAFEAAGIHVVRTIEEPEAAAIDFILKRKTNESKSRIIGVFDCGGGTTDITMIEVTEKTEHSIRQLHIDVLATDGHRRFGGNNLTEEIINMIEEKIKKEEFHLQGEDSKAGLRLFFKEEDESNEEMIKKMIPRGIDWEMEVRRNRNETWKAAEEWKIMMSNPDISEINKEISLKLVDKKDELIRATVGFRLEKREFEARINNKILEMIDKLKRMSEKTGKDFDLILLSGLSCQIPLIGHLFTETFGDIIRFSPDLKKCVAAGSLKYHELTALPGEVRLKVKRGKKLSSAAGILMSTCEGKKRFYEVFPQGTLLPTPLQKIQLPILRQMRVTIYQNLGTHEYFDDAPEEFDEMKKFDILIPGEIDDDTIDQGELYLQINEKLVPRISVKVGELVKDYN
ncbi:MAG: Hsp70 family protein [Candidatus Aminicenantes bacterium]